MLCYAMLCKTAAATRIEIVIFIRCQRKYSIYAQYSWLSHFNLSLSTAYKHLLFVRHFVHIVRFQCISFVFFSLCFSTPPPPLHLIDYNNNTFCDMRTKKAHTGLVVQFARKTPMQIAKLSAAIA